MEYLEGTTLKDRLAAGPLEPRTRCSTWASRSPTRWTPRIPRASSTATSNPPTSSSDSRDRVKVLDFGLAKMRAPATHAGGRDHDGRHAAGRRDGNRRLHGAGAGPRRGRGSPRRHLERRPGALRNGQGDAARAGRPAARRGVAGAGAHHLEVPGDGSRASLSARRRPAHRSRTPETWIGLGARRRRERRSASARARWLVDRRGRRRRHRRCRGRTSSSRRPAPLTDKDTIVLAEFTNTTGDPVFDDTLRQGLAVQLQQSPFLSLISDERIRRTLPLMNQPADARLTPDVAQGRVRPDGQRRRPGRIDRGARQSVRPRAAREPTARPATSSPTSRHRRRGKKMS